MEDMNRELNIEELEEVAGGIVVVPVKWPDKKTAFAVGLADSSRAPVFGDAQLAEKLADKTLYFDTREEALAFAEQLALRYPLG
jgi:hypothetical protein